MNAEMNGIGNGNADVLLRMELARLRALRTAALKKGMDAVPLMIRQPLKAKAVTRAKAKAVKAA